MYVNKYKCVDIKSNINTYNMYNVYHKERMDKGEVLVKRKAWFSLFFSFDLTNLHSILSQCVYR